ncbi:MAG TPA: hypothetical protein VH415_14985 [Nitrososphaeraceae archaeon]|jgi:hypothetical protein
MIDRGKPEFEPIERSGKKNERQFFCVECGGIATQTALFKTEGATIIERYCDTCTSKMGKPSTSGT